MEEEEEDEDEDEGVEAMNHGQCHRSLVGNLQHARRLGTPN
jgi:hypothetical protein